MAKQYIFLCKAREELDKGCAPFERRLSSQAETKVIAHALRAATKIDGELTTVTVNGIDAYDLIRCRVMLSNLKRLSSTRALFSFVRMFNEASSVYF